MTEPGCMQLFLERDEVPGFLAGEQSLRLQAVLEIAGSVFSLLRVRSPAGELLAEYPPDAPESGGATVLPFPGTRVSRPRRSTPA